MKASSFMRKFNMLVAHIRERGSLGIGEACIVINVGPWAIRQYAKAIVDACADIRFENDRFRTVIEDAGDTKQRQVTEFLQDLRKKEAP
jgi:hypothetical protein